MEILNWFFKHINEFSHHGPFKFIFQKNRVSLENSCTNAVQYTVMKTGFLSVKPVEGLLSKHATIMLVHISSLPCKIR